MVIKLHNITVHNFWGSKFFMDGFMHDVLITIHALGGLISFITGIIVLNPPVQRYANRYQVFNVFLISLAFMLGALYIVVIIDWPQLDFVRQAAFTALGFLGLYMAYRAFRAYQALKEQFKGWQNRYMGHVGFNIISLFEGFIIVFTIDIGLPDWSVGVIAILSLVISIWSVNRVKSKYKP